MSTLPVSIVMCSRNRPALLRDTIDILVEPNRFPRFRELGTTLCGTVRIPAEELASEIDDLVRTLRGRSTRVLAISPETAYVVYLGLTMSESRPLTRFERKQVVGPYDDDLAAYFASFCASISEVCEQPLEDGTVEVFDL